ncbi:MAG: TonB-dependent receptor [Steroidobacteraceae bacterium]
MKVAHLIRHRDVKYWNSNAALLLVLFLMSCSAPALSEVLGEKENFDIPAQPIQMALIEFSRQADVQVMGNSASLADLRSHEVKGKLRGRDALRLLLQDTGLTYQAVRQAVVIVSLVNPEAESASGVDGVEMPSVADDGGKQPAAVHLVPLGDMVVTGTHIPGSEPVGSSPIVIDREAIDRTGYATVQEVLRSLPQNFGGGPSDDTVSTEGNFTRGTGLNLRGLGSGATLTLINGRRMAPSGTSGSFQDVSSIPLAAVSRIEVLTDGASAIYGSDAVGGVINVIMRDDYQGAETQGSFGAVTDGALQETDVSQSFGGRWSSGHVFVSYDFHDKDALSAADRDFTADSDLRGLGGDNFSSRQSNPGNVQVGNRLYAIPPNQNGIGLSPNSFVPNAINFQNLNEGRDATAGVRRHSGFVSMSQSLGDSLTLSGDALYSRRKTGAFLQRVGTQLNVPATNPFRVIPAGASPTGRYTVYYSLGEDFGNRTLDVDVETTSASVAAKLELSPKWEVNAALSYATEKSRQIQGNVLNTVAMNVAMADPNPMTAFNPFGEGSFTNRETIDRIRGSTLFATDSDIHEANVIAYGGLFEGPGGEVRLAIGADYREMNLQARNRAPEDIIVTHGPLYERSIAAAFAEMLVPVVESGHGPSGIEQLQLSIAGRYDDYSDFGSTFNPRFGLEWAPTNGISIHGTWGKSFKAPSLSDLDERDNLSFIGPLPDPGSLSGDGMSPVLMVAGGNSELKAETADTWTVGVRWVSQNASSPTLDLSYFNLRFKDRIQAPPAGAAFLADTLRYGALTIRNPTAAQRAEICSRSTFEGATGNCLNSPVAAIVDTRFNNTSITTTRGLDLTGAWDIESDWGRFALTGSVSYVLDYSEAQTATAPISVLDTASHQLRFIMRDGISWSNAGFGASLSLNYAGGYVDTMSVPNRDVDSHATFDMQLSYEIDAMNSSWLAGCSIWFSVQNLFDDSPPFVNNSTGVGYDRENADPLNRFVSLRMRKDW